MTDDLPQLVQRLRHYSRERRKLLSIDHESIHALHAAPDPRHAELRLSDIDAAADRLDTLTRALAEQQEAHRREGNEWVEAMFNTTTETDRLREALAAMTQERDAALALASRQSVVLTELGDRYADEFNRAESATAAAREARAETWEDAEEFADLAAVPALAKTFRERATAARAGQP